MVYMGEKRSGKSSGQGEDLSGPTSSPPSTTPQQYIPTNTRFQQPQQWLLSIPNSQPEYLDTWMYPPFTRYTMKNAG